MPAPQDLPKPQHLESERIKFRELLEQARSPTLTTELSEVYTHPEGTLLWAEQQIPVLADKIARSNHCDGVTQAEAISKVLDRHEPAQLDPFLNWSRLNCHGLLHVMAGEFDAADRRLSEALEVAKAAEHLGWASTTMLNLAKVRVGVGDTATGARILAQLLQIDYSNQHFVHAKNHLADLFEEHSQPHHALAYRRLALDRCDDAKPLFRLWILAPLVVSLIEAGLYDEARSRLLEAQELASLADSQVYRAVLSYVDSFLMLRSGNTQRALELLTLAQTDKTPLDRLVYAICIPALAAEILLANLRPAEALRLIQVELAKSDVVKAQIRLKSLAVEATITLGNWQLATDFQDEVLHEIAARRSTSRALLEMHQTRIASAQSLEVNEQLVEIRQRLEQARTERDDVLDIVSHDVMSPLTTLRLLLHQLSQAPATTSLNEAVDNMLTKLDGILRQLSLLDPSGPAHFPAGSALLSDLLAESAQEYRWLAAEKNIDLTYRAVDGAQVANVQQPIVLRHIIDNLMSNAIKFSQPHGSVDLAVRYAAETVAYPQHWCVEVSDHGPGMDESDLSRVFTKFGRLSSKPSAGETTTGLGLYIASKLAKSIGGELSVESEGKGRGSQFYLCLPS